MTRKILFVCYLLYVLCAYAKGQSRDCVHKLCIAEDTLFHQKVYYQGQAVVFTYNYINLSDSNRYYSPEEFNSHFSFINEKEKRVEVLEEINPPMFSDGEKKREKRNKMLPPKSREDGHYRYDTHFLGIYNDTFPDYYNTYQQKNYYGLLKPGKYFLELKCSVKPIDKEIILRKEFEVKKAEGKLKDELMDFLKCINYCYRLNAKGNLFEKCYSPHFPTFTWYVNKYPNGIYTTDFYRFVYGNWRSTGFKPIIGLEDEIREAKLILDLAGKVNVNFPDVMEPLSEKCSWIDEFKRYGLIEDEMIFMDNFLKSMEDKPVLFSEMCIAQFQRFMKGVSLTNYAALKQKKG